MVQPKPHGPKGAGITWGEVPRSQSVGPRPSPPPCPPNQACGPGCLSAPPPSQWRGGGAGVGGCEQPPRSPCFHLPSRDHAHPQEQSRGVTEGSRPSPESGARLRQRHTGSSGAGAPRAAADGAPAPRAPPPGPAGLPGWASRITGWDGRCFKGSLALCCGVHPSSTSAQASP